MRKMKTAPWPRHGDSVEINLSEVAAVRHSKLSIKPQNVHHSRMPLYVLHSELYNGHVSSIFVTGTIYPLYDIR